MYNLLGEIAFVSDSSTPDEDELQMEGRGSEIRAFQEATDPPTVIDQN